jgi:serine/threonine protein kinase
MTPMLACPRCRATYPDGLTECPADGTTLLPGEVLATVDGPLEAGTMVGEYRVERKLGSGTFGDVYAGEQPLIGKRVAIKLLHRKFSSDAEVVSRFVAEARAVNRIRHKNIIDIFSFGLLGDSRHYFVMELLDGLTLRELLEREKRLSIEAALPIFRGIASGLDAAHEAAVTHRDLKPDNVFLALERDGTYFPKLLDFGIAKLLGEDVAHKTATGMAMGTPRYMSPEQCRGRKIDHRADIYSLGVLVHEVLTGRPLFDADSSMDMLFLHTSEPPAPMSSVSELPSELDGPVLAMLAKRPKDRPASAGEAIRALVESAREHGMAATLPASSAGVRAAVQPGGDADRRPPDAATVRVRKRGSSTPSGSEAKTPAGVRTVEMPGADSDRVSASPVSASGPSPSIPVSIETERDPPRSDQPASDAGRGATEVVPASRVGDTLLGGPSAGVASERPGGTLRSAGAVGADRSAASGRARGPAFWALVAIAAVVLVGGAIALSLSGGAPAATTAGPEARPSPTGTTPISETRVTPDPAPLPSASSTGLEPVVTPAPPPTGSGSGKPIARPKVHGDLESPPR